MLVLASITDSLVTFATHVIKDLGLPGVFLLVAADSTGIPIAAAAIMLFAGFDVSDPQSSHHFTLLGAIVAGTLGDAFGSTIAYWIGRIGRHELLETHGRKLHVTPAKLALAHRWFDRWGLLVIPVGRLLPFVRTFIGFPAGAAETPYPRFLGLTLVGAAVLCTAWASIGKAVGHSWESWKNQLHYVDYVVIALVVLGIVYLIVRRRRATADATA